MISQANHARSFFDRLRLPLIALASAAALFAFAACADTGSQGPQGEPGVPGAAGSPGETGAPGAPGSAGEPGDPGISGEPGSSGEPGNQGSAGSAGATGVTGSTGATGSRGATGESGSGGAAGLTGPGAGATLIVPLTELNDSGQNGIARLTSRGLQTEVVIEIDGVPDIAQPIHVHAGSCDTLGGVDYALSSVVNGFSSTVIDVSLPALREGLSAINLHKSGAEAGTYVACGDIAAAGTTVTISLNPLNDSGQAGTATLIATGDTTWVVVNVDAGPGGVSQPIHIHSGSCATLGGVEIPLTSLENGRSVTVIDSPISSILTGDRAVNLHKSGPEASLYTSCGDIPVTTVSASAGVSSDAVTLILNELNSSGQSGSVTLTPKGTKTMVAVNLSAGAVGVSQPVHIHTGSCDDLGGVTYPLTSLDTGMSATTVDVSISSLLSGRFAVNAHKSGPEASIYVSCGDIPTGKNVLTIALGELNSSGQTGTATLVANGASTDVSVIVTPGAAGVSQPIHIHTGSCETLGGVEYPLTSLVDGTSLSSVSVTLESLLAGEFAVNLHKSGAEASVYHACGNVSKEAAAVAASTSSGGSGGSTPAPDIQSMIVNFVLEDLTVSIGQTVIWENTDNAPHTVTHRVTNSDPPSVDSEFRSSTLTQSGMYSHVFNTAGTFQYFCEIHPNMRATITVS
ncbi:MAG: hypothetical protein IH960_07620 [Chloroflexi bacterium]|nr:hypothetical protein [Chloroflexota bacterium]